MELKIKLIKIGESLKSKKERNIYMDNEIFREMRRIKQQLSFDECKKILKNSKRAVLSVNGDLGYPYGVPVDYYYDVNDNAIYIHSAKEGHKIDAIKKYDKVSFTTWQEKSKIELGFEVLSVIIFGRAIFIDDKNEIEKQLWNIGNKYHKNDEFNKSEIERNLDKVQVIKIVIEHMTGKHINEF